MARVKNILNGGNGKVGTVILYERNGVSCMRSLPDGYKDKKSEAQLKQRQKMTLVHEFLRPFKELLKITFFEKNTGRSAYQSAQAYNLKNAIKGEYPNQYLNKQIAILCKGNLPLSQEFTVSIKEGNIDISWDSENIPPNAKHNDTLLVMLKRANMGTDYILTGERRSSGSYTWKNATDDANVGIWVAFRSADQLTFSNSMYLRTQI